MTAGISEWDHDTGNSTLGSMTPGIPQETGDNWEFHSGISETGNPSVGLETLGIPEWDHDTGNSTVGSMRPGIPQWD